MLRHLEVGRVSCCTLLFYQQIVSQTPYKSWGISFPQLTLLWHGYTKQSLGDTTTTLQFGYNYIKRLLLRLKFSLVLIWLHIIRFSPLLFKGTSLISLLGHNPKKFAELSLLMGPKNPASVREKILAIAGFSMRLHQHACDGAATKKIDFQITNTQWNFSELLKQFKRESSPL